MTRRTFPKLTVAQRQGAWLEELEKRVNDLEDADLARGRRRRTAGRVALIGAWTVCAAVALAASFAMLAEVLHG